MAKRNLTGLHASLHCMPHPCFPQPPQLLRLLGLPGEWLALLTDQPEEAQARADGSFASTARCMPCTEPADAGSRLLKHSTGRCCTP